MPLFNILYIAFLLGQKLNSLMALILLLYIYIYIFFLFNSESTLDLETDHYEDDDVAQERQRLYQQRNLEDSLVGKNISKVN